MVKNYLREAHSPRPVDRRRAQLNLLVIRIISLLEIRFDRLITFLSKENIRVLLHTHGVVYHSTWTPID